MSREQVAELFRRQAEGSLPGSPLYFHLLHRAAEDFVAGGIVATVLAGHEEDRPGSVLTLRLMGAVHRLVLQRQAPELATYFPSVGGTGASERAWPAFERLLAEYTDTVRGLLGRPVQTNDVGRSAPLFGGLLVIQHRTGLPVRLLEVGASAGLNLRVEHFAYRLDDGRVLGDPASEVCLGDCWTGVPPAPLSTRLDILERRGCDPAPIDPLTTEGRLTLTSYVWADWVERLERLRAALAVAARVPAAVDRAHADEWLAMRLAAPVPGLVTVVWHSVVRQYVEPAERVRAGQVLAAAATRASVAAPLAHLSLEPRRQPDGSWRFELWLTMWPGPGDPVRLGSSPGHGIPVEWADAG